MENSPLYFGHDILQSKGAMLKPLPISDLAEKCKSQELQNQIQQLKNLKNIDSNAYRYLKQKLPYFVCAEFKNNIRISSNFIKICYLVLDIDKYGTEDETAALKQQLIKDQRVYVAFISPGGDGLKLIFKLQHPIESLKEFSDFYKSFSRSFANQYQLEDFVDFKTNDATRICFLSFDSNCYVNPNPMNLDNNHYKTNLFDLLAHEIESKNSENTKNLSTEKPTVSQQQYKDILSTLNPKTPKPQKTYIIPTPLKNLHSFIFSAFQEQGLQVAEITDINYGYKILIKNGESIAVINLYYGKNGFTIVKNNVRNTCEKLLEVSAAIIENIIYSKDEKE